MWIPGVLLLGALRQWQGYSSALRTVSKHWSHFFPSLCLPPRQILTLSKGGRVRSAGSGVVPRDLLKPFRKQMPRALGWLIEDLGWL